MKTLKFKKPTLKGARSGSSSLKAPKTATDLYADLRDRRLLPLIALLIVAIVAVPFLLADSGSSNTVPPPPIGTAGATETAATFTVVPARRELREYQKRLKHRKAANPFAPYTSAPEEKAEEPAGSTEGAVVEETTTTIEAGGTTTGTTSPAPVVKATIKASLGVTAVVNAGYVGAEGPEVQKKSIESQAKLPNPNKKPVVVYAGPTKDGTGALFLMSTEVTAFYGKGRCVLGPEPCQELELLPGKSATFAIGYGETRYKVALIGFAPIVKEATIHRGR